MDRVVEKTRAVLTIGGAYTVKEFRDPADAVAEIGWYRDRATAWARPNLIDADPDRGILVIATYEPIVGRPPDRTIGWVAHLLTGLARVGVHHRDVHPGNIVLGRAGMPYLIDWETAVLAPGAPSYDLTGPSEAVPTPAIHDAVRGAGGYVMWWDSDHRSSIRNLWGVTPDELSA